MATAKATAEQTAPAAPPEMPAGFERTAMPDINGWYSPDVAPTTPVFGKIRGRIRIEDDSGTRDVVLVELLSPVAATMNQETVELKKGDCLAVGLRYQLRDMLSYVEHQGQVWFVPKGKRRLQGNRTMWDFDVGFKGKRSTPPEPAATSSDGGPIPF